MRNTSADIDADIAAKPHRRPRRWGTISETVAEGPLGRSSLYELAGQHEGLFRKLGARTIVDLDMYDDILAASPVAAVKPPSQRQKAAT